MKEITIKQGDILRAAIKAPFSEHFKDVANEPGFMTIILTAPLIGKAIEDIFFSEQENEVTYSEEGD